MTINDLCISDENAEISYALSMANIQSRFMGDFEIMPRFVDTPNHTIQGFVVNMKCIYIETIFSRDDHGVIFKNNNLWLFIDNDASIETNESIVSV